jgi:RND family efflux transporter MFP subunit
MASPAAAGDPLRHGTEAFTEPLVSIEVAASEAGRLAAVQVRRGDRVHAGQLLMELDTAVLTASRRVAAQRAGAVARIEALRVDHQQKQRRFDTLTGLLRDGAASAEELQSAESELRIAGHQLQAAEEERERYQLELDELETRIEQRRVRAPSAGIVTEVLRDPGEFVSTADLHVVTLVDLTKLRATFFLPTADAIRLAAGSAVEVEAAADAGGGRPVQMTGVIEHIAPLTLADSGRVRVDVVIDNADERYRSGVRCTLRTPAASPVAGRQPPMSR